MAHTELVLCNGLVRWLSVPITEYEEEEDDDSQEESGKDWDELEEEAVEGDSQPSVVI